MPALSLGGYLADQGKLVEAIDAGLRSEPSYRPSVREFSATLLEATGIDPRAPRVSAGPSPT
jgi:hypothetical protein